MLGGSGRVIGKQTTESRVSEAYSSSERNSRKNKISSRQSFYHGLIAPPPTRGVHVKMCLPESLDDPMNTTPRLRGHLYTCAALTYTIGVTTWNAGIVCCSCIRLPPFCFLYHLTAAVPNNKSRVRLFKVEFSEIRRPRAIGGEKNPYTISFREKKTIEIDRPQSGFQCRNSGIGKAIGLRWLSGPCQIDTQHIIPYP